MATEWLLSDALGLRSTRPRTYGVFVRDLVLPCRIGAYDYEKTAPQSVRINADLAVLDTVAQAGDALANVYNYETVVAGVRAIIAAGHINLVETLAERVAEHCLADERVQAVRVRVEKLDVYPEAESVGVAVERWRGPVGAPRLLPEGRR
jgi:dihydroneopterin aldolase